MTPPPADQRPPSGGAPAEPWAGPVTGALTLGTPGGPDDVLVVTGMSGAGRSTAAKVLEDLGWYVVDNLPPQLMPDMVRLLRTAGPDVARLAVAVDVRGRTFFSALAEALADLRRGGVPVRLLFLDADDQALVRRFESVRRPHPLQEGGRLLDGIGREREMMADLRGGSDTVIDTSHLNVHQLSAKVAEAFGDPDLPGLRVTVMSFGFKYGIPVDADHVADVRFLPNPFWVPELRHLSGLDAPVRDYVMGRPGALEFLDGYAGVLAPLLPGYVRENKRYLTVAVGCTGGKHRSVASAEALAARLRGPGVHTSTVHRDLGRE